jgi:hypothetical protein
MAGAEHIGGASISFVHTLPATNAALESFRWPGGAQTATSKATKQPNTSRGGARRTPRTLEVSEALEMGSELRDRTYGNLRGT